MSENQKISFIIAVAGSLTCLASFLISLSRADHFIASILFGLAGLFCVGTAIKIYKIK